MPTNNNPIAHVNAMRLGLCALSAPLLVAVAEAEAAEPVPLATEPLEETWLGYNEPRGLISNWSEVA